MGGNQAPHPTCMLTRWEKGQPLDSRQPQQFLEIYVALQWSSSALINSRNT